MSVVYDVLFIYICVVRTYVTSVCYYSSFEEMLVCYYSSFEEMVVCTERRECMYVM